MKKLNYQCENKQGLMAAIKDVISKSAGKISFPKDECNKKRVTTSSSSQVSSDMYLRHSIGVDNG